MTSLLAPENKARIDLHTACQRSFQGGGEVGKIDWQNLNRSEGEDCTFPMKVEFSWLTDEAASVFEIAENPEFTDARVIHTKENTVHVGNLKMNTRYFWRVNGSDARTFMTEDAAPRWMEAGGLSNVRDMGAWKSADGRRIRQGLIYRGSELDRHHAVTGEGLRVLREEMGIRTDLDLRGEAVGQLTSSPMGDDVAFVLIPTKPYAQFFQEEEYSVCKALFEVLADEKNYPIYYHCWGGADRTGTLALMLQAVLGVSEEDMLLDYELTSLSIWGDRSRRSELFVSLMDALNEWGREKDTINQKAWNFLIACGVSGETLRRLEDNLLE